MQLCTVCKHERILGIGCPYLYVGEICGDLNPFSGPLQYDISDVTRVFDVNFDELVSLFPGFAAFRKPGFELLLESLFK